MSGHVVAVLEAPVCLACIDIFLLTIGIIHLGLVYLSALHKIMHFWSFLQHELWEKL